MKNIQVRILSILGLATAGLILLPANTFAQSEENCSFGFGSKCFVSGVKTIHTDDKDTNAGLLDTIRNAINWGMGILATVALCVTMYGGLKMLTSGSDSKGYDAGLNTLKHALIGLAIIGLAWMIVSVVIWFVGTLSGGNQTLSTDVT